MADQESGARTPGELTPVELSIVWVGLDETDVLFVNQFVGQVETDTIFLSVGQLTPPLLVGTEDEQRQQAIGLNYVPVRPVGRFALSRKGAAELADILQQVVANYDRVQAARQQRGDR